MTVLDLDADLRLSKKTRFGYRHYADDYARPYLGARRVRRVASEVLLTAEPDERGCDQDGRRPGGANTVRLARAPLAGTFKLATEAGIVGFNPMTSTHRLPTCALHPSPCHQPGTCQISPTSSLGCTGAEAGEIADNSIDVRLVVTRSCREGYQDVAVLAPQFVRDLALVREPIRIEDRH